MDLEALEVDLVFLDAVLSESCRMLGKPSPVCKHSAGLCSRDSLSLEDCRMVVLLEDSMSICHMYQQGTQIESVQILKDWGTRF